MTEYKGYDIPETEDEFIDINNECNVFHMMLPCLCYIDKKHNMDSFQTPISIEEYFACQDEETAKNIINKYINYVKAHIDNITD